MVTRHAITRRADADGVAAPVVERDYILAQVVAQLGHAAMADGGRLVFKGGTALRLVHLSEYRYSADLDFTLVGGDTNAALAALDTVLEAARKHAVIPHLELAGADVRSIAYIGPLAASKPRHIKLDVAMDEHIESVDRRAVRDVWPDLPEPLEFDVYPVEEIAAEKLRCIIQRVQCRDLYDLFRLVEDMSVSLDEIRPLFERKTRAKNLDPGAFAAKFEDRIERYKRRWSREMGEHLAEPPNLADVVRVVRRHLRAAELLET